MIKPYSFTVDDFAAMVQAGLFHDQRVELLDGVIVDMTPATPAHEFTIDQLSNELVHAFFDKALVRVQNAVDIGLSEWLPHPDIVLVEKKDYSKARPTPEDIYLLIEVSNTSLELDLGRRRKLYAQVGIKEYWVADLQNQTWIVNCLPEGQRYESVEKMSFGSALEILGEKRVWL